MRVSIISVSQNDGRSDAHSVAWLSRSVPTSCRRRRWAPPASLRTLKSEGVARLRATAVAPHDRGRTATIARRRSCSEPVHGAQHLVVLHGKATSRSRARGRSSAESGSGRRCGGGGGADVGLAASRTAGHRRRRSRTPRGLRARTGSPPAVDRAVGARATSRAAPDEPGRLSRDYEGDVSVRGRGGGGGLPRALRAGDGQEGTRRRRRCRPAALVAHRRHVSASERAPALSLRAMMPKVTTRTSTANRPLMSRTQPIPVSPSCSSSEDGPREQEEPGGQARSRARTPALFTLGVATSQPARLGWGRTTQIFDAADMQMGVESETLPRARVKRFGGRTAGRATMHRMSPITSLGAQALGAPST